MKLIIDITEEQYKDCKIVVDSPFDLAPIIKSFCIPIVNGIPLPKGHGDLIDRDECLKIKMTDLYDKDGVTMYAVPTGNILRMKPIIEADKENKE